jgi:hypothetical protein
MAKVKEKRIRIFNQNNKLIANGKIKKLKKTAFPNFYEINVDGVRVLVYNDFLSWLYKPWKRLKKVIFSVTGNNELRNFLI